MMGNRSTFPNIFSCRFLGAGETENQSNCVLFLSWGQPHLQKKIAELLHFHTILASHLHQLGSRRWGESFCFIYDEFECFVLRRPISHLNFSVFLGAFVHIFEIFISQVRASELQVIHWPSVCGFAWFLVLKLVGKTKAWCLWDMDWPLRHGFPSLWPLGNEKLPKNTCGSCQRQVVSWSGWQDSLTS